MLVQFLSALLTLLLYLNTMIYLLFYGHHVAGCQCSIEYYAFRITQINYINRNLILNNTLDLSTCYLIARALCILIHGVMTTKPGCLIRHVTC